MKDTQTGTEGAIGGPSDPTLGEWRKAERERLIAARLAVSAETRAGMSRAIAASLGSIIGPLEGRTISVYWPFRGEPDLRPWWSEVVEQGASIALPVVIKKAAPLEFRAYRPGEPLEKGVWNIPVPALGASVLPDVTIAPLVGFDADCFRLGYGGGFFDRTLAAMAQKPLTIGVGYDFQRMASIRPQPYDVPMDVIVTECSVLKP
ncbi:MAG: 5-formyltetrahydrofolate cyclo-ligase [Rhizobiaceae bacterium]|nr:5-formyltetrahydrofolate cyclo-ligase [Rhizobiaceae bacterium]